MTDEAEPIPAQVVLGHQTGSLSPSFFRGLVTEMERLNDEAAGIAEQKKALREAAKDRGVNLKAFGMLIRRRAMDPQTRADMDESLEIYERVAGPNGGMIDGGDLTPVTALPAPEKAAPGVSKAKAELAAWLDGGIG